MSKTEVGSSITTAALASGLRLVTESMSDVRSVAIGFWVGSGSRDEPDGLAGASHFLEHLLFKGTLSRSAAQIAEALDEVGGDCNAYTTKEYTAFYVRLLSEHLALGLDILSDIMWTPALAAADVDAERTVILDEILMHSDEPSDLVVENCFSALFPLHPLGRDALGTASSVGDITRQDVAGFFEQHYRPENMVVSVAGDCEHDRVGEMIEDRFRGTSGGKPPQREAPKHAAEPLTVINRPTEQAHLAVGMRCVSRFDPNRWAFAVLNHVLGGGMSSRLFQKVREQRGLAYAIGSERLAFQDAGSLCVGAGTAPSNIDEVLSIVTSEIGLLAGSGVTERELAVAKGNLRAEALLACEDSGARMSRIGASVLLHNEVKSIDEILALIDAVDLEAVTAAARELSAAPRTIAAVGPTNLEHLEAVAGLADRVV
ncbi:MAG: M16 family metallopeptidase [Acidimicrobiales bacterium]